MKLLLPALAALSLFMFTTDSTAQPPGKGEKGANGQRRQGQGRPGQGGMDLAQMATRAVQQFDKDGDKKLDVKELTAFMTAMRDRRMGGGQGRPGMERNKGGKGQRPGGANAAGGEKPKRPPIEE